MLMVFMLLVGVATLIALVNWRWGIGAAIVLGLLQDPLRKVIPGTPAYLVLAGMPIWRSVRWMSRQTLPIPLPAMWSRAVQPLVWLPLVRAAGIRIPAIRLLIWMQKSWRLAASALRQMPIRMPR